MSTNQTVVDSVKSSSFIFTDILHPEFVYFEKLERCSGRRHQKCDKQWPQKGSGYNSGKFVMIILKERDSIPSLPMTTWNATPTWDTFSRWYSKSWIACRLKLSSTFVNGVYTQWAAAIKNTNKAIGALFLASGFRWRQTNDLQWKFAGNYKFIPRKFSQYITGYLHYCFTLFCKLFSEAVPICHRIMPLGPYHPRSTNSIRKSQTKAQKHRKTT